MVFAPFGGGSSKELSKMLKLMVMHNKQMLNQKLWVHTLAAGVDTLFGDSELMA